MRGFLQAGLLACAGVLLAGCYYSDTAFYSPGDAVYPFPASGRYQRFSSGTDGNWKLEASGTFSRSGDWYDSQDDGEKPNKPFIVKPFGNYLIVEAQDGNAFIYDLFRVDGNTIYDYDIACDDEDPAQLKADGLVSHYEDNSSGTGTDCTLTSADALEKIAQRRIDSGKGPDTEYVIQN